MKYDASLLRSDESSCEDSFFSDKPNIAKQRHIEFLRGLKYIPEFAKLALENNSFSSKAAHSIPTEMRRLRRLCKAGLLRLDLTIHFCLDKIDAKHVFSKGHSALLHARAQHPDYSAQRLALVECISPHDGRMLYQSVTSAELRFFVNPSSELWQPWI